MSKFKIKKTDSLKVEVNPIVDEIYVDIKKEREYQDGRWGKDHDLRHSPNDWAAFTMRYLAKTTNEHITPSDYRKNMIKVAALAIAAIEARR